MQTLTVPLILVIGQQQYDEHFFMQVADSKTFEKAHELVSRYLVGRFPGSFIGEINPLKLEVTVVESDISYLEGIFTALNIFGEVCLKHICEDAEKMVEGGELQRHIQEIENFWTTLQTLKSKYVKEPA